VLPTTSPPPKTNSRPIAASNHSGNWPLILACALALYTVGAGWGLISGNILSSRAFVLMALPCLLPMTWSAYGYFKAGFDKDLGLLFSAIGWMFILVALIFKDIAVTSVPTGATTSPASSPIAPVCAAFGIFCLIIGAGASWMFWASREDRATASRNSTHY
jgi:hypothetical protein